MALVGVQPVLTQVPPKQMAFDKRDFPARPSQPHSQRRARLAGANHDSHQRNFSLGNLDRGETVQDGPSRLYPTILDEVLSFPYFFAEGDGANRRFQPSDSL